MKTVNNIQSKVKQFAKNTEADSRYASFDYCYNYFLTTKDLTSDIEKSCMVLGFYLASWGMFRGSSFLLQKSAKHFEPTIRYIATLDKSVWRIDLDSYNAKNIAIIRDIYAKIKLHLVEGGRTDLTLVTKVMLGVFGFIPAFDQYFCDTFRKVTDGKCGFSVVNDNALNCIKEFYEKNKKVIDDLSKYTFTIDFTTGQKTDIHYPRAKIIDMYGFTVGLNK